MNFSWILSDFFILNLFSLAISEKFKIKAWYVEFSIKLERKIIKLWTKMQFRWQLLKRELHCSRILRNQQIIPKSLFDVSCASDNRKKKLLIMLVHCSPTLSRSIAFYQQTSTQKSLPREVVVTHASATTLISLRPTRRAKIRELREVLFTRTVFC